MKQNPEFIHNRFGFGSCVTTPSSVQHTHTIHKHTHAIHEHTHRMEWHTVGWCVYKYLLYLHLFALCLRNLSLSWDRQSVFVCVRQCVCSLVCCLCLTTTQWQQTLAGNMGKLSACLPQKKNLTKTLTQICCEECVSKVWQHCKTSRNTLNAFSRFKPTHTHTHTHTLHPSPPCV